MTRLRERIARDPVAAKVVPSGLRDLRPARAADADTAPSPGRPLDTATRQAMTARLGHDFAGVRVHADERAGSSALALGARAWTLGRDIVFAPGQYRPDTPGGRALLAHELTHVVQGSAGRKAESVTVDRAGSAAEREAQAAEAAVADGMPGPAGGVPAVAVRHDGPVIGRSLLGGLLGGGLGATLGAVGGALLGGLLGPVGAVVGGIVGGIAGFVGGAIVGDTASRQSRRLTSDEKTYARTIYHDAVDYDAITITRGSMLATGAARTIGNTINLQPEHFKGEGLELSDAGQLVLIHEMGHVWQYQNGGLAYIPSSLIPQIVAGVSGQSRNVAYDWRAAIRNHIPWEDWNAEQQAECISDYNEALRRINDGNATLTDYDTVTLAQPYIELVRQRIGAPGSSRRTATAAGASAGPGSGGGAADASGAGAGGTP